MPLARAISIMEAVCGGETGIPDEDYFLAARICLEAAKRIAEFRNRRLKTIHTWLPGEGEDPDALP